MLVSGMGRCLVVLIKVWYGTLVLITALCGSAKSDKMMWYMAIVQADLKCCRQYGSSILKYVTHGFDMVMSFCVFLLRRDRIRCSSRRTILLKFSHLQFLSTTLRACVSV